MAGFKKAGASFKKGYAKKRAGSDDEDDAPRASKKSKGEDSGEPFVPKLEKDDEKNQFVALNASGKRRVTVSSFKGNTLVSIREYYTTDAGELKPGKKGISMTLDQYNALLTAAPLLESVLAKENLEVARPNYDSPPSAAAAESGSGSGEDEAEEAASDDEDVVKE